MLGRVRTWYLNYGFLVIGIILLNVGLLNWYLFSGKKTEELSSSRPQEQISVVREGCDTDCINRLIDAKISVLPTSTQTVIEKETVVVEATPTPRPQPTTAAAKTTRIEYVSLPSGEASGLDWTSFSASKWIDTALYGELVSATWEGWIEIPGGSGIGYARLYDATNERAVDGSEVKLQNTLKSSFYSGNLSIWRGQNQYFIQTKSSGGGTVKVYSARIKLVVK